MSNKTSISDDNIYPQFCELAATNDNIFNGFRSNLNYKGILEHVTQAEGKQYLDLITPKNHNLISHFDKFKTSDLIGSPERFLYNGIPMSPTTMRYVKVLSDLIEEFGSLDSLDIVEIGCGYGGQAKIIMDVFDINSYTLIDLPPVLKLTEKFLKQANVDMNKIKLKTINTLDTDINYGLFISNYAYTECNKTIQLEYFDKVISKSKMGYITANFINSIFGLDYLTKEELQSMIQNTKLIEEQPKTHKDNIIITWK